MEWILIDHLYNVALSVNHGSRNLRQIRWRLVPGIIDIQPAVGLLPEHPRWSAGNVGKKKIQTYCKVRDEPRHNFCST